MQNRNALTRPLYRERLSPSLWILVAFAIVGPMVAFTFARFDATLALVLGVLAGVGIVGSLIALAPQISVTDTTLRAGRAHIDVAWLGAPVALTGEEARQARGPALPARGWHMVRGGIDGIVVMPNIDPNDPATHWTISTRTPDRLAAAIIAAQSA